MVLVVSPKKVRRLLMAIVWATSLIGVAAEWVRHVTESWSHRGLFMLAEKFRLNGELSLPAWCSSVLLLLCAAALGLIAVAKYETASPFSRHWLALAGIFLAMSIDELAAFHETLIVPLQRCLGASGIFHYAWVIPASMFVVGVGLAYRRFVFAGLDVRSRWRFILAGSIYVGAALGMEMAEGPIDEHFGLGTLPAMTAVCVEESLEMMGLVLFLHALLAYLAGDVGSVRICFESQVGSRRGPYANSAAAALTHASAKAAEPEAETTEQVLSTTTMENTCGII